MGTRPLARPSPTYVFPLDRELVALVGRHILLQVPLVQSQQVGERFALCAGGRASGRERVCMSMGVGVGVVFLDAQPGLVSHAPRLFGT